MLITPTQRHMTDMTPTSPRARLEAALTRRDNAECRAAYLLYKNGRCEEYQAAVDEFGSAAEDVRRARLGLIHNRD